MSQERTELSRTTTARTYRTRHRLNRIEVVKELAEAIRSHVENLEEDLRTMPSSSESDDIKFYEEVQHFETALIENALRRTRGHQLNAARLLGLNPTTLSSLIKRYNISNQYWRVGRLAEPSKD